MYKERHDKIGKIIQWSVLKRFDYTVSCNYWGHAPTAVVENDDMKVLWDFNNCCYQRNCNTIYGLIAGSEGCQADIKIICKNVK